MIDRAVKKLSSTAVPDPSWFTCGSVYARILFVGKTAIYFYGGETIHDEFPSRGKAEMVRTRWLVTKYIPSFLALCECNESIRRDFVTFVGLTRLETRTPDEDYRIRNGFRRYFPSMTLLVMMMALAGRTARQQNEKFVLGFYSKSTVLFGAALRECGFLKEGFEYSRHHLEAYLVCLVGIIIQMKDTSATMLNMILHQFQFLHSDAPDLVSLFEALPDDAHENIQLKLLMSLIGDLDNDLESRLNMICDVAKGSLAVSSLHQPWASMIFTLSSLLDMNSGSSSDDAGASTPITSFKVLDTDFGTSELDQIHAAFLLCGAELSTLPDAHEQLSSALGLTGLVRLRACAEGTLAELA